MSRVVGLTGGIGTGKSTVSALFEKLGATLIDADAITHELQAPGSPLLARIADAFGSQVIDAEGGLDRPALGALIFREADARQRLNAIVHPAVGEEVARRIAAARQGHAPLVIVDIPLLLEGGDARRAGFDAVVVVYAREEQQLERQMERDAHSKDEAEARLRSQLSIEEKRRLADHVIDNSGSLEETERQVRALYEELVKTP